ncbi:MAG: hypothetical protein GWP19_15370 [Planctomycetia bacterium]|nr:hypothetical protein [Planctomycetia bacterium]
MDLLEKENTIRRKWLRAFCIYASFVFLNNALDLLLICCASRTSANKILAFVVVFILVSSVLFLHYYCGYKKRGFLLLQYITIIGGLYYIAQIIKIISMLNASFFKFGLVNPILNIFYLLDISGIFITIYYLINCRRLYLLNYEIKYGNQKSEDVLTTHIEEKK